MQAARIGVPALVLAAAVSGWAWSRRPPPRPAPVAAAEGDPVAEERDLLRGELRRLGLENATLRAAQRRAADASATAPAPEAPEPERPTPEKEAQWLMARAAFLDDELAKQPRDARWAEPLEARAKKLAETRTGVTFVSAACRSTACRLEFSYADADARGRHIQQLGGDFDELPRVSYAYPGEPESHTRAIMYLTREDHPLPQLDYAKFAAANP